MPTRTVQRKARMTYAQDVPVERGRSFLTEHFWPQLREIGYGYKSNLFRQSERVPKPAPKTSPKTDR